MKQERRKAGAHERDLDRREQLKRDQRDTTADEPVRRLDGPAADDPFRGKSDGEILQRYEF